MTKVNCLLICGFVALLLAGGAVQAETIAIPDASFETPVVTDPPYTSGAEALLPWVGQWASIANPIIYGTNYGEGYIVPQDGDQTLYLNPGDPTYKPFVYQTLSDTYASGASYTLSAAAAPYDAQYPLNEGQVLTVRLGYWTGPEDGQAGPTIVAERLITTAELTYGSFTDFTAITGPVSGDAVGKPIVVYIGRADTSTTGPQYWVDNVRLDVVPEPTSLVLLASGLLGLFVCAWRKR